MLPPRALVATLLAVVLAGCASVPTSGPVARHSPQAAAASTGVQVAPLPPAQDATQLLVVEGFLHAMSVYQEGYPIARQYLTDDAAKSWHPEAGVQVYADGYPPTDTGQTVVLAATLVGHIDATGVYEPTAGNLRVDFGLIKNPADGQWRISRPPDGLLVSRYLFSTGFAAVDVHFLALSGEVLVPEPRYFPIGDAALRQAATAVLTGPSAWLAPAVRKPPVEGLSVVSAEVDETGLARVVLGSSAAQLTSEQRQMLLAEFTYTLSGFNQVNTVEVFVGAERWFAADGTSEFTESSFAQLNPAGQGVRMLFWVKAGKLERQRDAAVWADFSEVASGLPKVESLAVNVRQDAWAAVSGAGATLVSGAFDGQRPKEVRQGAGLLAPVFARTGELWSFDTSGLRGLRVYRDGAEVKVNVTGVPKGRLVAASLSPDGVRLALVMDSGGSTLIGLARVVRTDARIGVDGWHMIDLTSLGGAGSRPMALGWNGVTELAVLRNDGNAQTSVALVSQDGSAVTDIGPSDSTSLTALAAVPGRPALVLNSGSVLYRFSGEFDWEIVSAVVEAAAYPG